MTLRSDSGYIKRRVHGFATGAPSSLEEAYPGTTLGVVDNGATVKIIATMSEQGSYEIEVCDLLGQCLELQTWFKHGNDRETREILLPDPVAGISMIVLKTPTSVVCHKFLAL